MRRGWTIMAVAALAGCGRAGEEPAAPAETIRYEAGGCFGSCPSYVLTVSSNGRGWFEGRAFTAQAGLHIFGVTPAQFAEFRRRLAPWRPWRTRALVPGGRCGSLVTDAPTVEVDWSGPPHLIGASEAHLALNAGCDRGRNARLAAALARAPEALPILWLTGA